MRIMYDVQRESGEEYLDHYIYKSRNECNQIIVCEVYRTYNETLNFAFYVTTKDLKEELSKREHVPNKQESKLKRKYLAKKYRRGRKRS